ncbi:hypothetical protein [Cohnella caldifontis]|uniref:hypothetical protein n=1 Tax=Cohnella caldifontis TaxID=3027471 RepID=UPI0023ECFA28|nr:hypothetical protein [Cohnella sp. YIM B05605]
MEMQSIQARFSSQEQAESAVRKLASLRGDCFRLEREGGFAQADASAGSFDAEMAEMDAPVESFGWANEPASAGGTSFSLTAQIPAEAAEQARSVISAAGGKMLG